MNSSQVWVLVLLIAGIAFAGGGAMFGLLASPAFESAAERVEGMTPSTVAMLGDGGPGREVLIEGHISSRNPAQLYSFVAYIREELETDLDDEEEWVEYERVTPPLLLQLPDGPVQIQNDSYDFKFARIVDQDSDTRYQVAEAGDPAVAVGTLVSDAEIPRIDADFVALGTQAEYVAAQRRSATVGRVMGVIFTILGGTMILTSFAIWWHFRRR